MRTENNPLVKLVETVTSEDYPNEPSKQLIEQCNDLFLAILYSIFENAGKRIPPSVPGGFAQTLTWTIHIPALRQRAALIAATYSFTLTQQEILIVGQAVNGKCSQTSVTERLAIATFALINALPNKQESFTRVAFYPEDPECDERQIECELENILSDSPSPPKLDSLDIKTVIRSIWCWRWIRDPLSRNEVLGELINFFSTSEDPPIILAILKGVEAAFRNRDPEEDGIAFGNATFAPWIHNHGDTWLTLTKGYEQLEKIEDAERCRWTAVEKYWESYEEMRGSMPDDTYTKDDVVSLAEQYFHDTISTLNPLMKIRCEIPSSEDEVVDESVLLCILVLLTKDHSEKSRRKLRFLSDWVEIATLRIFQEHNYNILSELYQSIGDDEEVLIQFYTALFYNGELTKPPNEIVAEAALEAMTTQQRQKLVQIIARQKEKEQADKDITKAYKDSYTFLQTRMKQSK